MDRTELYARVLEKYGTEPDYPWMPFPDYAVLRHRGSRKWYGLVMDIPRSRLGLDGEGSVDVLDVKLDRLMIDSLLRKPGFLPGYHMDRRNWMTLLLDGTVPDGDILALLDVSYRLTGPKKHA